MSRPTKHTVPSYQSHTQSNCQSLNPWQGKSSWSFIWSQEKSWYSYVIHKLGFQGQRVIKVVPKAPPNAADK